eukprot:scaffold15484_cov125-Cylindrotheca_fusiformis.AAC.1
MLPFRRLPRIVLVHLLKNAVLWLNALPAADGVSSQHSPRYLMTGRELTYDKHVRLEFGAYVQSHEEHSNDMRERTTGAICLGPTVADIHPEDLPDDSDEESYAPSDSDDDSTIHADTPSDASSDDDSSDDDSDDEDDDNGDEASRHMFLPPPTMDPTEPDDHPGPAPAPALESP